MGLLELACSALAPCIESLARLRYAMNLIAGLTIGVRTSARLRQAILCSLSANDLSKPLKDFLSTNSYMSSISISHDESVLCACSCSERMFDLRQEICTLILKTALCASQDEISLDSSVSIALLNFKMNPSRATPTKPFYHGSKPESLTLASTSCFPSESSLRMDLTNHGWKETLLKEMSSSMKSQHESIINAVRNVTQDLEDRCNTAEIPFREEQERSSELGKKLKSTESHLAELDSQIEAKNSALDEIKLEKAKILEQTESLQKRFRNLSATHEVLQRDFDGIEKQLIEATRAADETAKQNELAKMAIVAGKDELYEEQVLKVMGLETTVNNLTEELSETQSRKFITEEMAKSLEELLDKKNEEFRKVKLSEDSKQTEIERFIDLNAKVDVEKQELVMKVFEENQSSPKSLQY